MAEAQPTVAKGDGTIKGGATTMKVVNKIREDYKKQAETQKVYFKMEKIDTLTDRQLYLRHRMRVKQGQNKPEDPDARLLCWKRPYAGVFNTEMTKQNEVDWYEQTISSAYYFRAGSIANKNF